MSSRSFFIGDVMLIVVQILLVLAVGVVSIVLMRGGANAKHLAIRRLLLIVFAASAILSIFFPGLLSKLAQELGIGRGTDLVLYAFCLLYTSPSPRDRTRSRMPS